MKDKCKLFDSLVGSILNYGAEIFGYNEGKKIELVHCKFLRKLLCVRKSTNLDGLYGELGRYPMKICLKIIMIKYWFKLLKLNNDCILKKTYIMLKEDADNNITYNGKNWAYQIKIILNEIGMSNIWIQQDRINFDIQTIKCRILDIYKQNWYSNINNSNRLISYSLFKFEFNHEKYLDIINIDKYRIALTQFRISSHNLAIEKGRHENIPRQDRKCRNCTLNQIEDEYHFLMICPKFYHLRRLYFKPYFCRWPTLQKFQTLMTSINRKMLIDIAKFIYFASKGRIINDI